MSRMASAAQASIWASGCSPSRERYSSWFAASPVAPTSSLPPVGVRSSARVSQNGTRPRHREPYRTPVLSRRPSRNPRQGWPTALGPIVEELRHPPTHRPRRRLVAPVRHEGEQRGPNLLGERIDGVAGRPAYRGDRRARAQREERHALVERQERTLADVDPALRRDREVSPARDRAGGPD